MQSTDQAPPKRLAYSPGLDGLRAVACLAVMLYHAAFVPAAGGYLGVNIFFTLSGFLITSLLLEELRTTGRINLRGFWRRRVFRIVPLLAAVCAAGAVWGLIAGGHLGDTTVHGAVASMLFCANWLVAQIHEGAGVLGANWSVSVEEQFYLVWPLLLWALYRWTRSERRLAWVVAGLAVAVCAHRTFMPLTTGQWARMWYGTDTQADALLIGAVVALGWRCRSRVVSLGAGIVLAAFLMAATVGDLGMMRLAMPAVAVCTALLLPYLQDHGGILAWGPLVALGRRSYGLYLWSCPINHFLLFNVGLRGLPLIAAVFVFSLAISEVTYRFLEVPMRRLGRSKQRPTVTPVLAVLRAA